MGAEASISIEQSRQRRQIEPIISDYQPDELHVPYADRVDYYRMIKETLGVRGIRTEFRHNKLLKEDRTWDTIVETSYIESLRAMREAGLDGPLVYLNFPDTWMVELQKKRPEEFSSVYRLLSERVKHICVEAGVVPKQVQVMNEVNWFFYNPFPMDPLVEMIRITDRVFHADERFANTKIMVNIITNATQWSRLERTWFGQMLKRHPRLGILQFWNDWRGYTKAILDKAGPALQAVGFDFYPGSYDKPALLRSMAFRNFGEVEPYRWILEEKTHGVLKDKEGIISETGVPAISKDSRFARFGYDRIVQAMDHLFLEYERKGYKAHDLVSRIGFFKASPAETAPANMPGRLDDAPWGLLYRDSARKWQPTLAGARLKHLIETRIAPTK